MHTERLTFNSTLWHGIPVKVYMTIDVSPIDINNKDQYYKIFFTDFCSTKLFDKIKVIVDHMLYMKSIYMPTSYDIYSDVRLITALTDKINYWIQVEAIQVKINKLTITEL